LIRVDCLDDYPLVGGDPDARIPPRSVLASLKPMGLGTPFRESLASYYLTLAHLHHLSPKNLARGIVIPKMAENGRLYAGVSKLWKLSSFNGIGAVPECWAKQLSELTAQKELIDLTLVPLRPCLSILRLMSDKKKWCPLCFSEGAKDGRVYGQLLWEIDDVQACPKHGIKLVSQCQCHGKSPLSPLNIKYLPGICESCGSSLSCDNDGSVEYASEDKVKRARLVADFLGDMEKLKQHLDKAPAGIPVFLNSAVRHFVGGKAALFGDLIGIKKNTLHGWMHDKCIPPFPQIVDIAVTCGCSIAGVMLGERAIFKEPVLAAPCVEPRRPFRTVKTQKVDKERVKRQLEALSLQKPPMSVAEAAAKIGVSDRTLFKHFGDITKEMTRRVQAYRHAQSLRKFEGRCYLYRQSAEGLMQRGIRPTRRLVALDIKGKGIVGVREDKISCSRICREVIQTFSGR
jgi:AraC-like DNA-binding protein